MSEAFITRRGGGTSLNFKIIGGTAQPTSPKENTIWVNTDTDITSWALNAAEPESPVEGMVWVKTSTSGVVGFNTLKKNGIELYIDVCYQYINGTWVEKEAMVYQEGSWILLLTYFYNNGNEYTDITGGWSGLQVSGDWGAFATFTKDASQMTFTTSNSAYGCAPANKTDLSRYTTLYILVETTMTGGTYDKGFAFVTSARGTSSESNAVAKKDPLSNGLNTIDISSINGEYYVVIAVESDYSRTFSIKEVYAK